jgi:hypothetical protein
MITDQSTPIPEWLYKANNYSKDKKMGILICNKINILIVANNRSEIDFYIGLPGIKNRILPDFHQILLARTT